MSTLKLLCRYCSRKEQYCCFFIGAPRVSIINEFWAWDMGKWWKIEQKLEWGDFTLWKCYVQGILRKKRYHGFFCGAPKINGWYTWNFSRKWQIKINKQDSWISTLKVLYTRGSTKKAISLFLWWSTKNFEITLILEQPFRGVA